MRVVLSASIMDMCHKGHLNILKEMRARGDKTIMVIHDDKSCFEIKGKFPIQDVKHRKRNILATGLIDKVLITKNTDPADQFRKVADRYEDILFVRGNDNYDFPGKWFLEKRRIPITFLEYTKGISSSKIREYLCI